MDRDLSPAGERGTGDLRGAPGGAGPAEGGAESPAGSPRIRVFAPDRFAGGAAAELAEAIRRAIEARGACHLALAGGSTPRPVYGHLARAEGIAWPAVRLYLGDERIVPPEDPRSNARMVREALLGKLPEPPAAFHPMVPGMEGADRTDAPPDGGDPERAAAAYGRLLPERLDVALLGLGEDGHTASLFPGSEALGEASRPVVPVRAPAGVEPPRRLTLTPPALRGARRCVVLAAGRAKAGAVRRALAEEGTVRDCPARLARDGLWLLDAGAAAELTRP